MILVMCTPLCSSFQLTDITPNKWLLQPPVVNESYLLIASLLQLHSEDPQLLRIGLLTNVINLGTEHNNCLTAYFLVFLRPFIKFS